MNALRAMMCLLSLSGFSTTPRTACEQVAASAVTFNEKIASCTASDAALPFDAAACAQSTSACTAADRAILEQFLGCVDRLPSCGAGDEGAFRTQLEACAAGARLSPGCSL